MQSLLHPPAAPHPCGCPGPSPRPRPRCGRPPRDVCRRVGWDPEGVLGPPVEGHIARREYSKKLRADEAFLAAEERRLAKAAAVKQAERDARAPPAAAPQLVEYLLNTPPEDMDFELVRARPLLARGRGRATRGAGSGAEAAAASRTASPLFPHSPQTPAFFAALRSSVTSEKLSARRNDARLAELEGLLAMVEARGCVGGSVDDVTGARATHSRPRPCPPRPAVGRGQGGRERGEAGGAGGAAAGAAAGAQQEGGGACCCSSFLPSAAAAASHSRHSRPPHPRLRRPPDPGPCGGQPG